MPRLWANLSFCQSSQTSENFLCARKVIEYYIANILLFLPAIHFPSYSFFYFFCFSEISFLIICFHLFFFFLCFIHSSVLSSLFQDCYCFSTSLHLMLFAWLVCLLFYEALIVFRMQRLRKSMGQSGQFTRAGIKKIITEIKYNSLIVDLFRRLINQYQLLLISK